MLKKIKEIMLSFFKSSFIQNVFKIFLGSSLSRVILVFSSPLLTRLYTAEDFGVYGVLVATISVFSVFGSLALHHAIIISESLKEALNIIIFILIFSVITSSFFGCILFLNFEYFLGNTTLNRTIVSILLIILLIFDSSYESLANFRNWQKKYNLLSMSIVANSFTQVVINLVWGVYFKTGWGLIIGLFLGKLVSLLCLVSRVPKINIFKDIKIQDIKKILVKHKNFPIFLLPSLLLERLCARMLIFGTTIIFGVQQAGYISLYDKLISLPNTLLRSSIGRVFRQEAKEGYEKYGECKSIFVSTQKLLVLLGIIPFLTLFLFAPELVSFIFGEKWINAGEYIRTLTPMSFVSFIVAPLGYMIYIGRNQKYDLYLQVYLITCLFIVLLVVNYFKNIQLYLILFSIVYLIKYIFEYLVSIKIAQGKL